MVWFLVYMVDFILKQFCTTKIDQCYGEFQEKCLVSGLEVMTVGVEIDSLQKLSAWTSEHMTACASALVKFGKARPPDIVAHDTCKWLVVCLVPIR